MSKLGFPPPVRDEYRLLKWKEDSEIKDQENLINALAEEGFALSQIYIEAAGEYRSLNYLAIMVRKVRAKPSNNEGKNNVSDRVST